MTESTARAERVNLQSATTPAYIWEAPDKPITISMPFPLIDRLEREVVENFRSLTSRGSEVGGILLGRVAPGNPATVYIDDYESIPCDYSRGPLYRLSDADMGRFERAIEQHLAGGREKVAGFFRSHTRKGLSLDAEDLSFFAARFRDPSNVALLVRPFATKASTAGFFIWENGSVQGETCYLEFPFRSSQLTAGRAAPAVDAAPSAPAVSPAAPVPATPAAPKAQVRAQIVPIASRRDVNVPNAPEPVEAKAPIATPTASAAAPAPAKEPVKEQPKVKAVVAAAKPAEPAKEADKKKQEVKAVVAVATPAEKKTEKPAEKPVEKAAEKKAAPPATKEAKAAPAGSKNMLIGVVAAVVLLIGMVLFVYPGVLRHGGKTPTASDLASLSLRVERTGTDILLTWSRDSIAIQRANHAVLSISDGDRHENYDMDVNQLRSGSIVYSPLTADVSFKMEVTGPNGAKTASESVRALRPPRPSPMPDGSQPPVETAKAPAKPEKSNSNTNTAAPAAEEAAAEEPVAPTKAGAPSKPFNTASLAQRLRPASPAEIALPEAPALNSAQTAPASLPNIGSSPVVAAPYVAPAAAPAPPPAAAPAPANANRTTTGAPAGGKISQATLLSSKQPEYPKLARQMGVKGTVEILASIGVDGHVKSVKVEKGHPLLVKAATDAVMQWVYKPTLLNGVPVPNDTHITLNFLGDK